MKETAHKKRPKMHRMVVTSCQHSFIESSLRAWLGKHGTCPICEAALTEKDISYDELNDHEVYQKFHRRASTWLRSSSSKSSKILKKSPVKRSNSMSILGSLDLNETSDLQVPPSDTESYTEAEKPADDGRDRKPQCSICLHSTTERGNVIVECSRCHCLVHQLCYGIARSDGNQPWLCAPCKLSASSAEDHTATDRVIQHECVLCTTTGGALQRTTDGRWAHIVCALWMPEVEFGDVETMCPIDISKLDSNRAQLTCTVCKQKSGSCIQCYHTDCLVPFHATCAHLNNWTLELPSSADPFIAMCGKHASEG